MIRALLIALTALLLATPALAREEIRNFDIAIEVQRNGDILVTETIIVNSEGNVIRRGIFRDLPRYYEDQDGETLRHQYNVQSVTRDGAREDYETETEDNAYRIRIGDPDVFIGDGLHEYIIRYRVKNQIRYFSSEEDTSTSANYDEIYWNATGNFWAFAIQKARATVTLPEGARVLRHAGYTGFLGDEGDNFTYRVDGNRHIWEITQPFEVREGLTIALAFEKGLIDPPSAADKFEAWWDRYGGLAILGAWLVALLAFLYVSFQRVGRDPLKGPVIPRYEPPSGYSPAAAHHIYYRGVQGHRALIATLMNLAVKGRIKIDASDKKETELTRSSGPLDASGITPEDAALETTIFAASKHKTLGQKYDATFTAAYTSFTQKLGRRYGSEYFRWNFGYTLPTLIVSVLVFVFAAAQSTNWTWWHTWGAIALLLINIGAMYFMPAPTKKGQQIRTEIEGLRLYMEKAEALQLNAVQPASNAPPPMTKERYERFLPYAVALGVEEPWTKHFERLIPEEASNYNPTWSNLRGSHALAGVSTALVANMSSGVQAAMPQSSSSSGSGGGGSSGGGGGGGGGGGW